MHSGAEVRGGACTVHSEQDDATQGGMHSPACLLQSESLSNRRGGASFSRRLQGSISEWACHNMDNGDTLERSGHLQWHPLEIEDKVGERDRAAGLQSFRDCGQSDCHSNEGCGDQLHPAGWGARPVESEFHVRVDGRRRRVPASEGRAEAGNCDRPCGVAGAPSACNRRSASTGGSGSTFVTKLLEADRERVRGDGQGGTTCSFGEPRDGEECEASAKEGGGECLEDRPHRRREDGEPGETLQGAVGSCGVPSILGGLEDGWLGCRDTHRDLGDGARSATDGSISALARTRDRRRMTAAARDGDAGSRMVSFAVGRPTERCFRQGCKDFKQKVKKELDEVRRDLRIERSSRAALVKGEIRRVEADQVLLQSKLEVAHDDVAKAHRVRNHALKLLKELALEKAALVNEVADLRSKIADLTRKVDTAERKEEVAQRSLESAARRMSEGTKLAIERVEAEAARALRAEKRDGVRLVSVIRAEKEEAERQMEKRIQDAREEADMRVAEIRRSADDDITSALGEAEKARQAAIDLRSDMAELEQAHCDVEWSLKLAEKREAYAKARAAALRARVHKVVAPTKARSVDDWAQLNQNARRVAAHRDREYLKGIFSSHAFRMDDVAYVLSELGLLEELFNTVKVLDLHFERVAKLMHQLEVEHFGKEFSLFLYYEMHLTMPKILRIVQAASKKYDRHSDMYTSKVMLYHPHRKGVVVKVPRIAQPRGKLQLTVRDIENHLGVQSSENGQLAFRSLTEVVQELLARDPEKNGMPRLQSFTSLEMKLPLVISCDATGHGTLQFNTIALRNPHLSASNRQLRIFGLGNCSDDRNGTARLLGPNLTTINSWLDSERKGEAIPFMLVNGECVRVRTELYFVFDVAALRHIEHVARSGWCGCSREFALRQTPSKPKSIEEMYELLKKCHAPSMEERFIWSHNPLPGEDCPRPCTAPGCQFAHDASQARAQLAELCAEEAVLEADQSKAGRSRYSKWRMKHADNHFSIQPGRYGRPLLQHDFSKQLLDSLHLSKLNLGKIAWKYGVLNHASDDAREQISSLLKEWKHPLDTRRKDDNRCRERKWFTGEAWASFCAGQRGSPGGPIAIAKLVLIVAEDMQRNGVTLDGTPRVLAAPVATAPPKDKRNRNATTQGSRGRAAFVARRAAATAAATTIVTTAAADAEEEEPDDDADARLTTAGPQLEHSPSAMELAADAADLDMIHRLFGTRAQAIINSLLSFDAYFQWYYHYEASIPFQAPVPEREQFAFESMCFAIDMHEMYERISIRNHKSFMPHGAIFKTPLDILQVANVHAVNTAPLELQNAATKCTATAGGSRRLQFSSSTVAVVPIRKGEGPARCVARKGYTTTMALSTLNKLLAVRLLQDGDGIIQTPESRRTERLFGVGGPGRASRPASHGSAYKNSLLIENYNPQNDSCIKAFVRELAHHANGINALDAE